MSLCVEMWSKTPWDTHPPALKGEMTSAGTRNPRPTGPRTLCQSDGGPPAALVASVAPRYSPVEVAARLHPGGQIRKGGDRRPWGGWSHVIEESAVLVVEDQEDG